MGAAVADGADLARAAAGRVTVIDQLYELVEVLRRGHGPPRVDGERCDCFSSRCLHRAPCGAARPMAIPGCALEAEPIIGGNGRPCRPALRAHLCRRGATPPPLRSCPRPTASM